MGWKKNNGGDLAFFKFEHPGDQIVGTWQGTREGKFGDNGLVLTKEKEQMAFSLTAALRDLKHVDPGTGVKIVYLGFQTSKAGNSFKSFNVFTWDPAKKDDDAVDEFGSAEPGSPIDEPPIARDPFQSAEDEIPF